MRRCCGCCLFGEGSGAFGEDDAGDVGVVVEEADVVPAGEQVGERDALAEADFEG